MLGRIIAGVKPGTFEARRLGVHALACGRPDLLRGTLGLNSWRGLGTVTNVRRGEIVVGDAPRRVAGVNRDRHAMRLHNTTHLGLDGAESSSWVFKNGAWRTPDGETPQSARLMFAFGRAARAGDQEIEIGRQVSSDAKEPDAIWVKAIGTTGTRVRYFISETTKYGQW